MRIKGFHSTSFKVIPLNSLAVFFCYFSEVGHTD